MYRVITASQDENSSASMKAKINDVRKDLNLLYNITDIADLEANESKFQVLDALDFVTKYQKKGMSFSEALDKVIDDTEEWLTYFRNEYKKSTKLEGGMQATSTRLQRALEGKYDLHVESPFQMYVPDDGDVQDFVDDVVAALGGRFYGTGRGGSWTKWNLRSDDNVAVNVGYGRSFNWAPEDSFAVEIVYYN